MNVGLILASTSKMRRELLMRAGLAVTVEPPDTDERVIATKSGPVSPGRLAEILAEAKAVSVTNRIGSGLVIGADQVLSCDGRVFNKPADRKEARKQLMYLRGRQHYLESAVCCAIAEKVLWSHVARAELVMRDFSEEFLDRYLAFTGNDVLTSVGGYKLEGPGIQLFSAVSGDYFTILGLPMIPLLDFLRHHGAIPS